MSVETGTQSPETITEIRTEIDLVDARLRAAILERFFLAQKIGALKESQQLPVVDGSREKEVKNQWQLWAAEHGLNFQNIEPIIDALIAASTSLQQK